MLSEKLCLIAAAALLSCSSTLTAEGLQLRGNADAVSVHATSLEFKFEEQLPKSGELRFPRLNARLKAVSWQGREDQPLTLIPEPTEWRVKLINPPESGPRSVVLELLDTPQHHRDVKNIEVEASADRVELPAHFAVTHGEKLRYEPQPHKNTVGYWTVSTDWTEWSLNFKTAGEFHLDILQGCGTGQGGSEVAVVLTQKGKQIDRVNFVVEETGHFQNFKQRRIGTFNIPSAGTYQLEIRPVKLAKNAVMDTRMIILSAEK